MNSDTFESEGDEPFPRPGRSFAAPQSGDLDPPGGHVEMADEVTLERLRQGQDRFIAIWGEMGQSWGIPRTMAETHALLFIVGEPLNTDDVMDRLKISRGSASTSLRALLDWGVVSRAHLPGDRKEYFRAEQDVWRMFRLILRERKRRELDPVLMALHECRDLTDSRNAGVQPASSDPDRQVDQSGGVFAERSGEPQFPGGVGAGSLRSLADHNERLDAMLEFMQTIDVLADQFTGPTGEGLRLAAGLLGKAI